MERLRRAATRVGQQDFGDEQPDSRERDREAGARGAARLAKALRRDALGHESFIRLGRNVDGDRVQREPCIAHISFHLRRLGALGSVGTVRELFVDTLVLGGFMF